MHLSNVSSRTLFVFVLSLIVGIRVFSAEAPAAVPTSQPSGNSDLATQLQNLQAQMQQMQAHEQDLEKQLQEQSALLPPQQSQADLDAQVLRDADQHSQLITETPFITGYNPDKGFIIASDDGNFLLHPFLLLQVRDVSNWRNQDLSGDRSNFENGFEIRRMQIGFDGNVFSPDVTYRIFIQTDRTGGDATLFDAWVKYHFHDTPFYVEAGQFKTPFSHEQLIFDRTMMAADRTVVDDILSLGEAFSQGIMGIYDNNGPVRLKYDFTNGYDINDVNFENTPTRADNFGMSARGEYKFFGNWKDYDQFTSLGDKQDLLVAGAGADWSEGDPTDTIRETGDVQWNHGPLGVYGGFVGKYTARTTLGSGKLGNTFDYGPVAQISYLLDDHWEPFARYDYLKLDSNEFTAASHTNTNVDEFCLGVNYYFYGQNLKLTFDTEYLPNGSPVDDNGSGVLVDNNHGEEIIRVQLQLAI